MSDPVFWENKKNITNMLSAENFTQSAKHYQMFSFLFSDELLYTYIAMMVPS